MKNPIFLTVFFTVLALLGWSIYEQRPANHTDYKTQLAFESGVFMFISDTPYTVGSHLHWQGQVWLITKLSLQNAEELATADHIYFADHPGPRVEKANQIVIEMDIRRNQRPPAQWAVSGMPVD